MDTQPSLAVISRNVAALRNAKKWTQGELAQKAELSQKVISNLENADTLGIHPTFHTITSVAKALHISLFVLMLPIPLEKLLETQKQPKLEQVIDTYLSLPSEGRVTVDRVLELEAINAGNVSVAKPQPQGGGFRRDHRLHQQPLDPVGL